MNEGWVAGCEAAVGVAASSAGGSVAWKSWNCTLTRSVSDAQFGTLIVSTPLPPRGVAATAMVPSGGVVRHVEVDAREERQAEETDSGGERVGRGRCGSRRRRAADGHGA